MWRLIVIKIEVRQNGVYEPGYPYNASVDEYFRGLTTEFINNYGLSDETVLSINEHKNTTLQFDRDLNEFVVKLSAFIVGFETDGQQIIDAYEILKKTKEELELKQRAIETERTGIDEEFDFVLSNINQLKEDIEKIIDLIAYYSGQIVDETYSYSDSYIDDTNSSLLVIEEIRLQNETEFEYNYETLKTHIMSLVEIKESLLPFDFASTSLRIMYEEWQKRNETYYRSLVEYFKNEYESKWTYGSSLMYGEKVVAESASMKLYKDLSAKWQASLFKRFTFSIDKEVKQYSLVWLEKNSTFDEFEFISVVENKKVEILKREIYSLEQTINDKKQAIKTVIPYDKEQNYHKYKEIILEKRKYIIGNLTSGLDDAIIDGFDIHLDELKNDYDYVNIKMSQGTYWEYFSDWEMHTELLTELKRQLDKSTLAISRDFNKETSSNTDILEKIEFYTAEKNELVLKVNEMIKMKDKLELDSNVYNDELTLISSKLYENSNLIEQKRNEYVLYFDERISFFTQNVTTSENEGIVELLNGNFFRDFDDSYDTFINYSSNIKWYSVDDREKLKSLYSHTLDIIKTNLSNEWEKEFSHEILNTKKKDIFEYYLDRETRLLYAHINKHLLDETYSEDYVEFINEKVSLVKKIFGEYVDISFNIESNIVVITNLFDYDDTFEFDISGGDETKENVKSTFFNILDDIVTFSYNKNIEYKTFENLVDIQEKIDQVWLDMEKKYV